MTYVDWWLVAGVIGLVMFLMVLGSCIQDLRRSRGTWFEEEITKRENTRREPVSPRQATRAERSHL